MDPTVTSVGNINTDLTFYTRTLPERDSEGEADFFMVSQGGSAANFAVGVSRLGIGCAIVGCVGKDHFGRMAVESLRREGVRTGWILECDLGTGAVGTAVETCSGTRTMIAWRGANRMLPEAIRLSGLAGSRHIHVSNVPMECLSLVMEKRGTAKISFDPGGSARFYMPEDLSGIDFLMLNESELKRILGEGGIAKDLLTRVGAVVLKQGPRGATLYSNGRELKCAPFSVEVTDTTGAGDAFDAGFVSAVVYGKNEEEALRWGCAAAALKIGKRGAREGLPSLDELLVRLSKVAD